MVEAGIFQGLGSDLQGQPQASLQGRVQRGECCRDGFAEKTGALAAAGDQQVERPVRQRCVIGSVLQR